MIVKSACGLISSAAFCMLRVYIRASVSDYASSHSTARLYILCQMMETRELETMVIILTIHEMCKYQLIHNITDIHVHVGISDNIEIMSWFIWLSLRSCHLFHGSFILHGGHQFLSYSVVNLHELCHASVEADGLSFGQLTFVVLWGYALLVT